MFNKDCKTYKLIMEETSYEKSFYGLVEDEVACAVCLERMQNPKSLRCLHVFCARCIERVAGKGGKVKCPHCRKITKVSVV